MDATVATIEILSLPTRLLSECDVNQVLPKLMTLVKLRSGRLVFEPDQEKMLGRHLRRRNRRDDTNRTCR